MKNGQNAGAKPYTVINDAGTSSIQTNAKTIVIKSAYCRCKPHGRYNSVGVCVICKKEYQL